MKKTLYKSRSSIHGKGLCLKEGAKKGEKIGTISGDIHVFRDFTPEVSKKMVDWIGVGRYSWIDTTDSMFRLINHSCNPNVAIKGQRTVYALKDIPPKTELTMDYSLTEAEPGWNIPKCQCKSENCRQVIGPIDSLSKKDFKAVQKHIPKKFQKIYEVEAKKKP